MTCTPVDRRTGRAGRERKEKRHTAVEKFVGWGRKFFRKSFGIIREILDQAITTVRFCSTTEVVESVLSKTTSQVYLNNFERNSLFELGTSLDFTGFDDASCACVQNDTRWSQHDTEGNQMIILSCVGL